MTARARDVFAALVDAVVAPRAPLPPVTPGGAPAAFGRLLAASPRLNAFGLVALLLALDAAPLLVRGQRHARRRFRLLSAGDRRALLAAMERGGARPLAQALRALALFSYYGDDAPARVLGYDADAVLARASVARAARSGVVA